MDFYDLIAFGINFVLLVWMLELHHRANRHLEFTRIQLVRRINLLEFTIMRLRDAAEKQP